MPMKPSNPHTGCTLQVGYGIHIIWDLSIDKDIVALTSIGFTKEGYDSHKTYVSSIG